MGVSSRKRKKYGVRACADQGLYCANPGQRNMAVPDFPAEEAKILDEERQAITTEAA